MPIPIKELIAKLQQQENQDEEVEYVICSTDGRIVSMVIETKANEIKKLMKMFPR